MPENIIIDILARTLSIEKKVLAFYRQFAERASSQTLRLFWKEMAREEGEHVSYWAELYALAREGTLPQVFDDPEAVKADLDAIDEKADDVLSTDTTELTFSNMFLLAYRLEFRLLHPAFTTLLQLAAIATNRREIVPRYEKHLSSFIDALQIHGNGIMELELLAETLKRLWNDNKMLHHRSSTDPVMGILNRRGFFNTVEILAHLARRRNYAAGMMMIDIDHFKNVNDTFGHQTGDTVLREVAQATMDAVRNTDVVGRYGGEEILVFLSPVEIEAVPAIAEKVRRSIEDRTRVRIPVTVSIGVAGGVLQDKVNNELAKLIWKADHCLYKAKESGRNQVRVCLDEPVTPVA
jgi:diguanylate cyclase (GGDEF)-like protein